MKKTILLALSALAFVTTSCSVSSEKLADYMIEYELINGTAIPKNPAEFIRSYYPQYAKWHKKDIAVLDVEYINMLRETIGLSDTVKEYAPQISDTKSLPLPEGYTAIMAREARKGWWPRFHAIYGPYNIGYSEWSRPTIYSNASFRKEFNVTIRQQRKTKYTALIIKEDENYQEEALLLIDKDYKILKIIQL